MSKKLFIAIGVLLVLALTLSGVVWQQWTGTKNELNASKALLDTTKTQLHAANLEVQNTKVQLDTVKTQFDVAKSQWETQQRVIAEQYSNLRSQVNRRLGDGKDKQTFITPSDPLVSATVEAAVGSYKQDVNQYWADCQRLYRWVVDNIKYNEDSYTPVLPEQMSGTLTWQEDYWRTPAETLNDKAGDCEDMGCLLASMLLNYNQGKFGIWVLLWQSDNSGHIAVAFPVVGGKLAILDPAGNYYTGYYSGSALSAEDIATATNNWLSYWGKQFPNPRVSVVFSEKLYCEFSSTQEFIDWARTR
jgi:hypothetical protein